MAMTLTSIRTHARRVQLGTSLSDPALSDPALSDPALSDPALPDPALPDPALSDPALSDPALPSSWRAPSTDHELLGSVHDR